jgi:hypothetical protein
MIFSFRKSRQPLRFPDGLSPRHFGNRGQVSKLASSLRTFSPDSHTQRVPCSVFRFPVAAPSSNNPETFVSGLADLGGYRESMLTASVQVVAILFPYVTKLQATFSIPCRKCSQHLLSHPLRKNPLAGNFYYVGGYRESNPD